MRCAEAEPLIGASLDGESDVETALLIDNHVATCNTCSALLGRLERLREEISTARLDWSSGSDLRPLAARIRRINGERWWKGPWVWRSLTGAVAVAALVIVLMPRTPPASTERQIVDSHLRSLLAGHLVDVPSSDQHTVKPWFQGKLGFAPAVPDLSADDFVLVGGRLDVIGGRSAAAIVYKRRQHIVNLWVSAGSEFGRGLESATIDGFHVLHWRQNGMLYWAVSDLNAAELRAFAELIRSR